MLGFRYQLTSRFRIKIFPYDSEINFTSNLLNSDLPTTSIASNRTSEIQNLIKPESFLP